MRLRALLILALALAVLPLLAGCGLHPGGEEIAYLRDGALWVVNPDGSDPRQLASGSVVGFAWSPDHHMLAYRDAMGTSVAVPSPGSPLGALDSTGNLTVVSINGGAGVTISPNLAGIARSDAWWDANGNRLLYREEPAPVNPAAYAPSYLVSQNDQPLGIARKFVFDAASLPTLSPDGSQVAVLDPQGDVRLGPPGQKGSVVASHALLSWPESGTPTRVLWQPGHDTFLYESPSELWGFQGAAGNGTASGDERGPAMVLQSVSGGTKSAHALFAVAPDTLDVAFSPDGTWLLIHQPQTITAQSVANFNESVTWTESDPAAQAWWSPDGRYVLLQDNQGLRLGTVATGKIATLLTYATPLDDTLPQAPLWTPTDASPWSPDGSAFVFASPPAATWQGHALPGTSDGASLYAVTLTGGSPGTPSLLVRGAVYAPSWSYLDPSATFLQAAG